MGMNIFPKIREMFSIKIQDFGFEKIFVKNAHL